MGRGSKLVSIGLNIMCMFLVLYIVSTLFTRIESFRSYIISNNHYRTEIRHSRSFVNNDNNNIHSNEYNGQSPTTTD